MKEVFDAIKKHLKDNGIKCGRRIDIWKMHSLRLYDKNDKKFGNVVVEESKGGFVVRFRYKTKSGHNAHKIFDMSDPASIDNLTAQVKVRKMLHEV